MNIIFASLFYGIGVFINLLVWFKEFKAQQFIRFTLDVAGTFLMVVLAGGGVTAAGGALWASMLWSLYLNKFAKFPDWCDFKPYVKAISIVLIIVTTIAVVSSGVLTSII